MISMRRRAVRRRMAALGVLAILLLFSWPVTAQTATPPPRPAQARQRQLGASPRPHRLYLSVTGVGDIERFSNDRDDLLNGSTAGLGAAIGTFLTARWKLEFEGAVILPINTGVRVETTEGSAGGLNMRREERTRMEHRTDTGTVLLAFQPSRRGRVQMAYAAGLAFMHSREDFSADIIYTDQNGTQNYHYGLVESYFALAPVLQIEASIGLTRRASLTPYFKAIAAKLDRQYTGAGVNYATGAGPGAFVLRPGVALRVWF